MPAFRTLLPALLSLGLASAALAGTEEDVRNAASLGEAAVRTGLANSYDLGVGVVDVFAATNNVGEARTIATSLCQVAHRSMRFEQAFTVRVFLVSGQRPAATCKTSR